MYKTFLILFCVLISSLSAAPYLVKNFFARELKQEEIQSPQTDEDGSFLEKNRLQDSLKNPSQEEKAWVVFFKEFQEEKLCISLPDEPKIENMISPEESFRLSCFDEGVEYSLQAKIFKEGMDKDLFLADYVKQLKDLAYVELIDQSMGEKPFGCFIDLFYQEENLFFCRERIFITEQGIYHLLTKSPDRPTERVEQFLSSFEILS